MKYQDYFFNVIINNYEPTFQIAGIKEEDFIRFLLKNNVFNLFYSFTKNSEFKNKYKSLNLYNVINNQYIKDEIWNLLRCFGGFVLLLKGISLFETIYSDDLNRHISDVDVYVQDYHAFKDFLINKGFKKTGSYPETFRKKNIKIDVHTDLINKNRNIFQSRIIKINSDELISKNLLLLEKNIYRLNNELEYLYLISHLFIHHNISYLKWLADIFIYNKQMSLNKYLLIELLNMTGINNLYIIFEKIFYKYLNIKIIKERKVFTDYIYKVIGTNRYCIHFYFLDGFTNKIRYFIFIIKYLFRQKIIRSQNG